jgi:hypothetical protein
MIFLDVVVMIRFTEMAGQRVRNANAQVRVCGIFRDANILPLGPARMARSESFELPTFWFKASQRQNPNGRVGVAYEP